MPGRGRADLPVQVPVARPWNHRFVIGSPRDRSASLAYRAAGDLRSGKRIHVHCYT